LNPQVWIILNLALEHKIGAICFFPKPYKPDLSFETLTEDEKEILLQLKRQDKADHVRVLTQVKALVNLRYQEVIR